MSLQFSVGLRNAMLDAIESSVGPKPTLRIFSGPKPWDCAGPDAGAKLIEIVLPERWMEDAANGNKTIAGLWSGQGLPAAKDGTNAGHFRIYDRAGKCWIQGGCGRGPGELSLDNLSIASGQNVEIEGFTLGVDQS